MKVFLQRKTEQSVLCILRGHAKTSGFVGLRRSKEAGESFSAKKNGAKRTLHIKGPRKDVRLCGVKEEQGSG